MIGNDRSTGTLADRDRVAGEAAETLRHPPRVLVVEDQVLIALSLIADLSSMGCEIVGRAASGERAIELCHSHMPDVVLMDVHLAGTLTGIDTATTIQKDCAARIIFLTAFTEGPDRARMEALAPAAILSKPYDPEQLAEIVAAAGAAGEWRQNAAP